MPQKSSPAARKLGAPKMPRSAAVLGFKNLSQAPEFAWLSTGFAEMLTAELMGGSRRLTAETVLTFKEREAA